MADVLGLNLDAGRSGDGLPAAALDEVEYIKLHLQLLMLDAAAETLVNLQTANNLQSFSDQYNRNEQYEVSDAE